MALPYLDNPGTLDEMTVMELDGLVAKLNAFLLSQHDATGAHTAVTANSLTLNNGGALTLRDQDGVPTTLSRTRDLGTKFDIKGRVDETNPFLSIRYKSGTEAMTTLVQIGRIGAGAYGLASGIRLGPTEPGGLGRHIWDIQDGSVSAGPALIIGDGSTGGRPLVLVFTAGHYEWRPNVALADVWLGSAPEPFEEAHVRRGVFEHTRAVPMGDWTQIPYAATNFSTVGGGTSWGVDAGDVLTQRYSLIGQTLHYIVVLTNTDVTGTPTELLIKLPASLSVGAYFAAVCLVNQAGGGNTPGIVYAPATDTSLHVITMNGAPWTATAADNTTIFLDITCEVTG
jgi:hypothetical protein